VEDTRQYPTNNATAVVAFFTAFIPVPFLTGAVAIALGVAALREIRQTAQTGRPVAIAAIVVGAINLIAWLFPFLFFGVLVNAFTHPSGTPTATAPTTAPTAVAAPAATPAPASGGAPASGDVWVCKSGGGATSSTAVPSPDCQALGYAVRVYAKPLTPYYHCGHWNVHELHVDGNPDGPNASTIHYDENWNKVPSGAC
jgi:hypothetical protein